MSISLLDLDELIGKSTLANVELLTGTGEAGKYGSLADLASLDFDTRGIYQRGEMGLYEEGMFGQTQVADDQGRVFMGYEYDAPDIDLGGYSIAKVSNNWILKDPNGNEVANSAQVDGLKNIIAAVKAGKTKGGTVPSASVIASLEAMSQKPTEYRKPIYQSGYNPGEEVQISKGMVDLIGPSKAKTVDPETGEVTYTRAGYDAEGNRMGQSDIEMQMEATREAQKTGADVDLATTYTPEVTNLIREQGEIGSILEDVGDITQEGIAAASGNQRVLQERAAGLLTQGMNPTQEGMLRNQLRAAEVARGVGALYDKGAVVREGLGLYLADQEQQAINEKRAMGLLSQSTELGSESQRLALENLKAEGSFAADPSSFITPANPGASSTLLSGQEFGQTPTYLDPSAGIDFGYNRNVQIAENKIAENAQDMAIAGGVLSGGTSILSNLPFGPKKKDGEY
jgi:hypothetical protein